MTVADPGFPRGATTQKGGGVPTYYLAKICRKLHKNEENWAGGRASKTLLCRPATE